MSDEGRVIEVFPELSLERKLAIREAQVSAFSAKEAGEARVQAAIKHEQEAVQAANNRVFELAKEALKELGVAPEVKINLETLKLFV